MWQNVTNWGIEALRCHISAIIEGGEGGGQTNRLRVDQALDSHADTLVEEEFFIMRKFVLAAVVATSALGLAACGETADKAGETVDAMAADAEANAEAAGEMVEGAADATTEAAGDAADATSEAAGDAADAVDGAVEEATAKAEEMMGGE